MLRAGSRLRVRSQLGAIRVFHAFPVAIVVLTSLVLTVVAHRGAPAPFVLLRVGLVVLLSQISVGALNDYLDRSHDALYQPEKPIPSGAVSPRLALAMVVGSLVLLLPLSATFGPWQFALIALGTGAGISYDVWLKPTPLSFLAYIVGFLTLLTWIWTVAGSVTRPLLFAYPAAAVLLVVAHLAQSLPDIEIDAKLGQRGLAVWMGTQWAFRAIILMYAALAATTAVFALVSRSVPGLLFVAASDVLFSGATWRARTSLSERPARVTLFHAIAPALALLALGGLFPLSSVV